MSGANNADCKGFCLFFLAQIRSVESFGKLHGHSLNFYHVECVNFLLQNDHNLLNPIFLMH